MHQDQFFQRMAGHEKVNITLVHLHLFAITLFYLPHLHFKVIIQGQFFNNSIGHVSLNEEFTNSIS